MSENNFGELLSNNFCASSKPEDKKELSASKLTTEPSNEEEKIKSELLGSLISGTEPEKSKTEFMKTRDSVRHNMIYLNQRKGKNKKITNEKKPSSAYHSERPKSLSDFIEKRNLNLKNSANFPVYPNFSKVKDNNVELQVC